MISSSPPRAAEFIGHKELVNRIRRSDYVTPQDIETAFDIYDPGALDRPSLGVHLLLHYPYLILARPGLDGWMLRLVHDIPEEWVLRQEFVSACKMGRTEEEAKALLIQKPIFLELILRALLLRFGFDEMRHWEKLMPQSKFAADAIVAHLRDGQSSEVRLLLSGPDDGFDGGPLIEALRHGDRTLWTAAAMTASRTPARFLFRGWRFQLPDADMTRLVERVLEDGNLRLTRERRAELVESQSRLPVAARQLCWAAWYGRG